MRLSGILFLSLVVLCSILPVVKAADKKDSFLITDAWVREAPPNTRVLAAYMTLHNRSDGFRVLEKVSSPDFEKIEVHKIEISDGVMRMLPVKFLEIGPGKDMQLQPGGYHMMLRNPKRKLHAGDAVRIELHFKRMQSITIEVPVMRADNSSDTQQHNH